MSMRIMDDSQAEVDWELESEAIRPGDGALIRRWFRCRYESDKRLQHTEDRYYVVVDGRVESSETIVSSPFLTWYPLDEALGLLRESGYVNIRAHSDFKMEPATEADTSYIVLGEKPEGGQKS